MQGERTGNKSNHFHYDGVQVSTSAAAVSSQHGRRCAQLQPDSADVGCWHKPPISVGTKSLEQQQHHPS